MNDFPSHLFQSKVEGGHSPPQQLRAQVGPALPFQGHSHTATLTRLEQFRHTSLPQVYISWMWEETGVPRGNLRRHGKSAHSIQRMALAGINIFLISIIRK